MHLTGTSDLVRVVTSAAVNTDVYAAWTDLSGTTVTPGRTNTAISTATTTTVVGSPAASTYRRVKTLTVRNRGASPQTVTMSLTDGTTSVELIKVTLQAEEVLHYHEAAGFWIADTQGREKVNSAVGQGFAATNELNLVVLSADVTNNNATANTIADVTGLSFSVTAGETYRFRFVIDYTSAATATGSRWSINGPTTTRLSYSSRYSLTATTETVNHGLSAYDTPAASNVTSAATGANQAIVQGYITPSANGTVIARFASEVSSSAIVAKAGSLLEWYRTI
jgi:hypothetical protein